MSSKIRYRVEDGIAYLQIGNHMFQTNSSSWIEVDPIKEEPNSWAVTKTQKIKVKEPFHYNSPLKPTPTDTPKKRG